MYRRDFTSTLTYYSDPWISLDDHPNNIIYGAGSRTEHPTLRLTGSKVFIRNSQLPEVICRDNDISENLTFEECAILCRDSITC